MTTHKISKSAYCSLTATPFQNNITCREIPPCAPLRPYIRCYWGSELPYCSPQNAGNPGTLVIPDTCADLMYDIDYTAGRVTGGFCGINDKSFYACSHFEKGHIVSTFCVRFYAWNAYRFSEDTLKDTVNGFLDCGARFAWLDKALRDNLFELHSLQEKIAFTEKLFLKKMESMRTHQTFDQAVRLILENNGNLEIAQLSRDVFLSSRQLERIFHDYAGVTPKKLSSLIRYQALWREILSNPGFQVLDAVQQFGYTDQPHLLKEFKRYHSMDIGSARRLAMNHVENIQEKGMLF